MYQVQDQGWKCSPVRASSMWGIAAFLIVVQFFLQFSLGVIAGQVRIDLTLDAIGLSVLASSYYLIYVLLQSPAGFLIDLFGSRRLLAVGALICMIGCVLFASAPNLWIAIIARTLMGGGMAFAFICSISIARNWFPRGYYVILVGAAETVAMAGGFLNVVLEIILRTMSWRVFHLYFSVILGIISLLAWLILRDPPAQEKNSESFSDQLQYLKINIKKLLRIPAVWILGLYGGFYYTIPTVFGAVWGIPFLQKVHHLTHVEATFAVSILFVAIGLSAPLISWMFSNHPKRNLFMIVNPIILSLLLSFLIMTVNLPVQFVYILTMAIGFLSGGLILSYSLAADVAPRKYRNTCVGIINTLALGLTPICVIIIGVVLDLQSDTLSDHNIELYTPANYRWALIILPIWTLLAAVVACFMPREIKSEDGEADQSTM